MDRVIITQYIQIIKIYYKNEYGRWMIIFRTKFSSPLKHISDSVGMLLKKNCRIWGSQNPQVIEKRKLHTEKVTV